MAAIELNPRQRRFIDEYLIDFNRQRAIRAAGYSSRGGYQQAHQLLKNPKVRAEIRRRLTQQNQELELTQDRVLREQMCIAFADIRSVLRVDEDGQVRVLPSDVWSEDVAPAVKNIRYDREGRVRSITFHDKAPALHRLMQNLGLLPHQVNVGHLDLTQNNIEQRQIVVEGAPEARLSDVLTRDELRALANYARDVCLGLIPPPEGVDLVDFDRRGT
jgi:phage terminase small subunit